MDPSFIPVQVTPSKTPFGLDQLRRSYKTSLSAEDAIAAAPAVGDADEAFPLMFLMPISTPESAESATRIDLNYQGSFGKFLTSGLLVSGVTYLIFEYHTGDDFTNVGGVNTTGTQFVATGTTPTNWTHGSILIYAILPAVKHSLSDAIASATTYTSSAIFPAVATVPASVEYHAHTSVIVVFSTSDTSAEVCPDPAAVTVDDLVTWTLAATQPASSFSGIAAWLLANAFVQRVIETINSDEAVPGQFYQITKRKITQLYPYAPP